MKRSGFTMIELIFVIVILGILAAVAIPKLAATRDDAKIASVATEAAQVISDSGAYYTAQGSFSNVGAMTNVTLYTNQNLADKGTDSNVTLYLGTAGESCLSFDYTPDGNITVADDNASTSAVCEGVQKAVAKLKTTHVFGGQSVNWD